MNKPAAYSITTVVVIIFGVFFLYPVGMTLAVAFEGENGGFTMDYVIGVFSNPVYVEGLWNALM
ncbi:MAG TPA: ABC transporter permease, partial [Verrucomicrobiales bacterium]|nr:ABC transporter permease [Verrucomicrobiales bacterium]